MVDKQKTTYYLDPDVVAGMKMLAATVGQTESGVVEEAVRNHLRAELDTLRPQLEDLFSRLSAKGHRLSDQDAWELASRGVKETRALREASTSRSKRPQAVEGGIAQPTESLEPAEAVSGAVSEAEGTVRFVLDGSTYEIDLNAERAQALRDTLARYVQAARRGGGSTRRPARRRRRAPAGGADSTEVREWAKGQGIEVKDRGRVPADLVARFKAATGQ
jgi:Lsr2